MKKKRRQTTVLKVQVMEMIKHGSSYHDISVALNLKISEVHNLAHKALAEVSKYREKDRALTVQTMLLQYDYIQQCAHEDYVVSKLPTQTLFDEDTGEEVPQPPRTGDQQTLRTMLAAMQAKRELTGMDYPKLKEVMESGAQQQAIDELLPVITKAMEMWKSKQGVEDRKSELPDTQATPKDKINTARDPIGMSDRDDGSLDTYFPDSHSVPRHLRDRLSEQDDDDV